MNFTSRWNKQLIITGDKKTVSNVAALFKLFKSLRILAVKEIDKICSSPEQAAQL